MKKVIEINLPRAWTELSNDQLYYVYSLLADNLGGTQIRTLCLFSWGKIQVVCRYGDTFLFRRGKEEFTVPVEVIVDAIKELQFLEDVPTEPVRISRINGHEAVDTELNGVPFGTYLFCENLYQGYLRTQNMPLLIQMAYPVHRVVIGDRDIGKPRFLRRRDNFLRRQPSIRKTRMNV